MLAQFCVTNFMSIRDRAVLNLTADNSTKEHPEHVVECGKLHCLRSVAIYGANASGKSSLLKAMTAAILTVRESQNLQINDRLGRIIPFAFDEEMQHKPTAFEFTIMIDGVKYVYGFSATQESIVEEYLYAYFSSKPSRIFERNGMDPIECSQADKKEFTAYETRNTKNKLFLSTATAWNCQKTKPVYLWFAEKIDTFTDDQLNNPPLTLKHFKEADSPELRAFTKKLLHSADINIDDYEVTSQQMDTPVAPLKDLFGIEVRGGTLYNVNTHHTMPDKSEFYLDLAAESLGTQNLFFLSPFLFSAFSNGKTLFIDEMSCLHSILVRFLVGLFNDPDFNSTNAQLIFATHDISLLDLSFFRRDQIYFVEKDGYGRSELYSLDDFSVRASENVGRAYLLGRYGAVPNIRGDGVSL